VVSAVKWSDRNVGDQEFGFYGDYWSGSDDIGGRMGFLGERTCDFFILSPAGFPLLRFFRYLS
jgi:hypothetical protein